MYFYDLIAAILPQSTFMTLVVFMVAFHFKCLFELEFLLFRHQIFIHENLINNPLKTIDNKNILNFLAPHKSKYILFIAEISEPASWDLSLLHLNLHVRVIPYKNICVREISSYQHPSQISYRLNQLSLLEFGQTHERPLQFEWNLILFAIKTHRDKFS